MRSGAGTAWSVRSRTSVYVLSSGSTLGVGRSTVHKQPLVKARFRLVLVASEAPRCPQLDRDPAGACSRTGT